MNAIEAVSLSKTYHRSRTQALSDINISIRHGEIFTLLGRNGAGKTTFLRIAATQLMPTGGSVSVLGHDARTEPLEIRCRIAVVPQEGGTIGPLTPWDHIYLSLLTRGMSRRDARERAEKTVERLELTDYRNQPADLLSGGLRQRIRVAMAVATDAELIFLDEPTLGLDAVSRRRIWGVLSEIQKEGRSMLLTTHYIDEAEILSNEVAVIDHGRKVLSGRPAELLRNVKKRVRVDIVGTTFSAEELHNYGRVVRLAERFRVLTDDQRGRQLADEAIKRGSDVGMARVSLEDLFVDLVGRDVE
ncbi:MAG TPA: ABC transporter ATP-binding protein [Candidatus Dormibacteraeota bacterium]|nr:ABC transporter ATP-binding protein [Candidatus Dormibacteraeota bacterium]